MACELGFVQEADGSARYSQGLTEVIVAVYGPAQPKYMRQEDPNGLTIDVSYTTTVACIGGATGANEAASQLNSDQIPPSSVQQRLERQGSKTLTSALQQCVLLHQFPRQCLYVRVTVVHDDGSTLSAAVIALSLALLNAGVPISHVPLSVTVAILNTTDADAAAGAEGGGEGEVLQLVDPTCEETAAACSTHTYMARVGSPTPAGAGAEAVILHGHSVGSCSAVQLAAAQDACLQRMPQLLSFVRSAVAQL